MSLENVLKRIGGGIATGIPAALGYRAGNYLEEAVKCLIKADPKGPPLHPLLQATTDNIDYLAAITLAAISYALYRRVVDQ